MDGLNEPLGAALLRRVFKEYYQSDWSALFALRKAADAGVDPFRYCAAHLNLSEQDVYARAAKALEIAFTHQVPPLAVRALNVDNIDQLKSVASLRGTMLDRDVLFIAPDFWHYVELAKRVSTNHQLRGQLCMVAPSALRSAFVVQQGTSLYESAIVRLARKWPFASAHLGLSNSPVSASSPSFAPWR